MNYKPYIKIFPPLFLIILLTKICKMKAIRERHYRSEKGTVTFVYIVNAKADEVEEYKAAQGKYYREYSNDNDDQDVNNGKPLYFTTRALPNEINLEITTNGKVVVAENTEDVAAKVAEQEDLIAKELAKLKAEALFARARVSK